MPGRDVDAQRHLRLRADRTAIGCAAEVWEANVPMPESSASSCSVAAATVAERSAAAGTDRSPQCTEASSASGPLCGCASRGRVEQLRSRAAAAETKGKGRTSEAEARQPPLLGLHLHHHHHHHHHHHSLSPSLPSICCLRAAALSRLRVRTTTTGSLHSKHRYHRRPLTTVTRSMIGVSA